MQDKEQWHQPCKFFHCHSKLPLFFFSFRMYHKKDESRLQATKIRFFQKFEQCLRERFSGPLQDKEALNRLAASLQLFYKDFYEEGDRLLALFSIHEEEIHLYDDMYNCLKNAFYTYYAKERPEAEFEMDYFASLYASFVMTSFEWILKNRPDVDVTAYFKKFYRSLHGIIKQDESKEKEGQI